MLHDLANSMSAILSTLTSLFAKAMKVADLAPPIPEDPHEQEAMFAEMVKKNTHHSTWRGRGQRPPCPWWDTSHLQFTPSVLLTLLLFYLLGNSCTCTSCVTASWLSPVFVFVCAPFLHLCLSLHTFPSASLFCSFLPILSLSLSPSLLASLVHVPHVCAGASCLRRGLICVQGPRVCAGASFVCRGLVCAGASCLRRGLMCVQGPHVCAGASCVCRGLMCVQGPHVCAGASCVCRGLMCVQGPHVCAGASCVCRGLMCVQGPHVCAGASCVCRGLMCVQGPHVCAGALCVCFFFSGTQNMDVTIIPLCPQVSGPQDFEWVKNVRYYWDPAIDDCIVRMSNSSYVYDYEYLGASPRLVITPLTVSHAHTHPLVYGTQPYILTTCTVERCTHVTCSTCTCTFNCTFKFMYCYSPRAFVINSTRGGGGGMFVFPLTYF